MTAVTAIRACSPQKLRRDLRDQESRSLRSTFITDIVTRRDRHAAVRNHETPGNAAAKAAMSLTESIRGIARRVAHPVQAPQTSRASMDYQVLEDIPSCENVSIGWDDEMVARRQDEAYDILLDRMYKGQPRCDLVAAARAVQFTGLQRPSILEVGCGSGYYAQVLEYLVEDKIHYIGLDYSRAMIDLARSRRQAWTFLHGDATQLPLPDNTFDLVFNGVALMHMPRYDEAIREAVRVSRAWCIMHSVPVLQRRATTFLQKRAYGRMTSEIIFNERELRHLLCDAGLIVRTVIDSIEYDLAPVLGEKTMTKTFVCEKN